MKQLIVLLVFFFVSSWTFGQEVGLQLYSLRNQFKEDVTGTLDLISSWDLEYLEGGGTYGMSMPVFKGALKQRNLKVVSVGAAYADLKEGNYQKIIDNAKLLGHVMSCAHG